MTPPVRMVGPASALVLVCVGRNIKENDVSTVSLGKLKNVNIKINFSISQCAG